VEGSGGDEDSGSGGKEEEGGGRVGEGKRITGEVRRGKGGGERKGRDVEGGEGLRAGYGGEK